MVVRIKRIVAFIIDWNLCLLPFWTAMFLLVQLVKTNKETAPIIILLCLVLVLSAFAVLVLRDVIFRGRSIGKRIFKLHIIDANTKQEASAGKKIASNLFFLLMEADAIVLLASGKSIGNYVTNTEVVPINNQPLQNQPMYNQQMPNQQMYNQPMYNQPMQTPPAPKHTSTSKIVLIIVGVVLGIILLVVGFIAAIFGIVYGALESQKDNVEYQIAYEFLLESEDFKLYGCDEDDVRLNGVSKHSQATPDWEGATSTAEYTFTADHHTFKVVCHKINDEWQVCDGCTHFN